MSITFYINLPRLFKYIKKNNIAVIWTLHDCWSFTGQCPYFDMANCYKWLDGCHDCAQFREYPSAKIDMTKLMYKLKRKWFTNINNCKIITPSKWLADLVKRSYLKNYDVRVIHNGIDLNIFKPRENNLREKYNIPENKFIILGCSFAWGFRKGQDVFIKLAQDLDEKKFQIVMVGTDNKNLPGNIIQIPITFSQYELAEIYSGSDVLANPTREENYPAEYQSNAMITKILRMH